MFLSSVVRFLVMALIALALLEVAPGLAAPMVAEVARELGITTAEAWRAAEAWKVVVLGAALFVLANLNPGRPSGGRRSGRRYRGR
jgi:hypothetical protein